MVTMVTTAGDGFVMCVYVYVCVRACVRAFVCVCVINASVHILWCSNQHPSHLLLFR